jgi:hypothetical protein
MLALNLNCFCGGPEKRNWLSTYALGITGGRWEVLTLDALVPRVITHGRKWFNLMQPMTDTSDVGDQRVGTELDALLNSDAHCEFWNVDSIILFVYKFCYLVRSGLTLALCSCRLVPPSFGFHIDILCAPLNGLWSWEKLHFFSWAYPPPNYCFEVVARFRV